MPYYCLTFLACDGSGVANHMDVHGSTDEMAISVARSYALNASSELWQGDKMIARITIGHVEQVSP